MAAIKSMQGYERDGSVVLARDGSSERGLATWRVRCRCGEEFVATGYEIRRRKVLQCRRCSYLRIGYAKERHGETGSRLHGSWSSMKSRCSDPNSNGYQWAGARGIKMFPAWEKDYLAFANYVRSELGQPQPDQSLARIDRDKDYEPGNIKWMDPLELAFVRKKRGPAATPPAGRRGSPDQA